MASQNKRTKTERFTVKRDATRERIELTDGVLKGRNVCKVISVNVPGIRALLKNEDRRVYLRHLIEHENPEILLLQEHKLQEIHLAKEESVKSFVNNEVKNYQAYWTFSTAKKGYSGVASFVRKDFIEKYPIKEVKYKLNDDGHIYDNEGRVIILHFNDFSVFNLYVPNSGQKLQRLDDRTNIWDKLLLDTFKSMKNPFVSLGDYNVAFRIRDMHNFYHKGNVENACSMEISEEQYKGVRNLLKLAGCTVQERKSFKTILDDGCVVDSFIAFNGDISGCFTYWSQRSNNRPFNQGLRLDYSLVSPNLLAESEGLQLVDTFHLDKLGAEGWGLSDHCPVGSVLLLPP